MPKINVYLPDDLAAAVREAGIPVSPVCQQALSIAVRAVAVARRTVTAIRDPEFDPARHPALDEGMRSRFSPKLGEVLRLAERAGRGRVGTAQLLLGVIEQGDNMGLRLLQAMDIDTGELAAGARQADTAEPRPSGRPAAGPAPGTSGARGGGSPAGQAAGDAAEIPLRAVLTLPAWRAFAGAIEAGISLGHNYLGCEHLVLGLIAESDGVAGDLLRRLGATPDGARRTLTPMVAGYLQGRQSASRPGPDAVGEILRRLDALEARVAALGGVSG